MKILQINNLYQEGSTGKIVYDIHKGLQEKGEISLICYANGRKAVEKGVYKVSNRINQKIQALRRRFFGDMYGGCLFSTRKIIRIIKKEKPDVVHLHCINAYTANIFKLLNFLKKYKQYTILTQHAEFMYTANCGHALDCEKWKTGCGKCPRLRQETKSLFFDRTHSSWLKMKKAFEGFQTSRMEIALEFFRNMPNHLFGGENIKEIVGYDAHNYLQQGYDLYGIIAFIALMMMTIHIGENVYFLLRRKQDIPLVILIVSMMGSLFIQCVLEPILTSYPICFWFLLMLDGIATAMNETTERLAMKEKQK